MPCNEPLPINSPFGEILLYCTLGAGHGGRHESPPPSDLPITWPASEAPKIVWGVAKRRAKKAGKGGKAPMIEPPTAATLARAEGFF